MNELVTKNNVAMFSPPIRQDKVACKTWWDKYSYTRAQIVYNGRLHNTFWCIW